jgi:hypothetical protein
MDGQGQTKKAAGAGTPAAFGPLVLPSFRITNPVVCGNYLSRLMAPPPAKAAWAAARRAMGTRNGEQET